MAINPLKKEFIDMFRLSGWTQAETARQLGMTRGGVNGIITGRTVPSQATVKLFKLLLMSTMPEVLGGKNAPAPLKPKFPTWGEELFQSLQQIDPNRRNKLIDSFLLVIQAVRSPSKRRR